MKRKVERAHPENNTKRFCKRNIECDGTSFRVTIEPSEQGHLDAAGINASAAVGLHRLPTRQDVFVKFNCQRSSVRSRSRRFATVRVVNPFSGNTPLLGIKEGHIFIYALFNMQWYTCILVLVIAHPNAFTRGIT